MSQENVDVVLRVYEAFRRHDNEAVFAMYDPAVEWNMEGYLHWPGKGSGVPIERYHAQVWTFKDGRVLRIEVFDSRETALAAHVSATEDRAS